ncbi:Wings apart-like protein regulation of heterochromatin protein [Prunus dulcis]|uniref:Wings apart-like protein regulation of heterochromatin protein n=1 Tax=Prunus dulcis TaxID=3755 RepID=A0A4Y1R9P9_PRUDU|nr:Wings apart-like protein regulation of heterochromatin protein [Prunus dulcis]
MIGGIPRTYSDSTLNDAVHDDDDSNDPFGFSVSQPQESSQDHLYSSLNFSSQDSSSQWAHFDSDPYVPEDSLKRSSFDGPVNGAVRRSKKAKTRKEVVKNSRPPSILATSTLMEAQEFGEMMEHVDEVNFALDGLRKGQPVRIRRASLLSLLSICGTAQQRRLLRTQGMAKTIIEAILGLSFDDSPSNLAATTIFYVLTSDGQDDHLLESPSSINFLIRFCKPIVSNTIEDKAPKIGRKLLALRMGADISQCTTKKLDSSSAAIFSKVQEILVGCKELKPSCADDETSGTVRKSGSNFKEKLRELGGLDAVFEVSVSCHSDMEGWLKDSSPSAWEKEIDMVRSLVLLLKCLKIMENATFLSKENQSHLLGMKRHLDPAGNPMSFTELVISAINILSGLYLHKNFSSASNDEKSLNLSNGSKNASEKSSDVCQGSRFLPTARSVYSISSSETTSTSMTDTYSVKTGLNSSRYGSSSGTSRHLNGGTCTFSCASRKDAGLSQRSYISDDSKIDLSESQDPFAFSYDDSRKHSGLSQRSYVSEDSKIDLSQESQDPFAFDEDDFKPSKWDLLSGKKKISLSQQNEAAYRELDNTLQLIMSQEASSNVENHQAHETSYSGAVGREGSGLLADCLLTAVKVLMNLANDNPVGCQQIAANGGLETLSSLIANHFPLFSSLSSPFSERSENTSSVELGHQNNRHLTDQELDFLVAILGLLVNLVEKDGQNRSRLAAASVHVPSSEGFEEESRKDLILLICSIFLANQGAGEENDEAAVLQGEQEAEKMIVEAYSALLLAFLSTESKSIRDAIADCLPDRSLAILVPVLDRFVAFHLTLNMISPETHKAVSEFFTILEQAR